jgi:GTPase SAR1 family protein
MYSVISPTSYRNIYKWATEIKHYAPETPFILVGTKIDARDDPVVREQLRNRNQSPLLPEDGTRMAAEICANKFVECSALNQLGLKNVFDEAVRMVLWNKTSERKSKMPKKSVKCAIL